MVIRTLVRLPSRLRIMALMSLSTRRGKSVEIHLDLPIMREVFGKAGDALREFDANADPSDSGDEDMNTYSSESDSGKDDEEDKAKVE